MKILKLNILCIVFSLFYIVGEAQTTGFYWSNLKEKSNRLQGKISGETYYISSIANRFFFLQDDWVFGKIVLEDGDVFEDLRLRYLIKEDKLISYNSQFRTLYVVDKEIVNKFTISDGNKERVFEKKYYDGFNKGYRYYENLYSGNLSLLAYHHIDEIKVSPYTDRSGIMRDIEYRHRINYYIFSEEKGFQKVNRNRRSYLKVFPEYKKQIRRLFRKNKVTVVSEGGMIHATKLLDLSELLD